MVSPPVPETNSEYTEAPGIPAASLYICNVKPVIVPWFGGLKYSPVKATLLMVAPAASVKLS